MYKLIACMIIRRNIRIGRCDKCLIIVFGRLKSSDFTELCYKVNFGKKLISKRKMEMRMANKMVPQK